MTDDRTRLSRRCTECGADLPLDATEGLCPACLMAAAMSSPKTQPPASIGDDATVLSTDREGPADRGAASRLAPGQAFGPYRIERLLGRGGMGEVYEAEQLEHGRRVALKVLNQRLAGPDDRARFLREGQLAASIAHPNAVYIFGSEEIAGTPVISMELVTGGTLKDRLERDGRFTPAEAVDAVLDVIAGLDAAQAGGILHRDIKPSNCFVDADGHVKVGDFGLSISTLARDVAGRQEFGTFQGTPQYAAPEQLRGQPLDVRADIYAVGATIFYLLTGGPPFDDRDLTTLVARVTSEAPPSPRTGHRRIPAGLAAIVQRCLAKDRASRFASYAELEDALRPFSSAAPVPAAPGIRIVAGVVDKLILALLTAPATLLPRLKFDPPASVNFNVSYGGPGDANATTLSTAVVVAVSVMYYVLLEGIGDASLGKRLCGLRVSRLGQKPGVPRALLRTLVFMLPLWFEIFGPGGSFEPDGRPGAGFFALVGVTMILGLSVYILPFTSMRRRNGYAAWQDFATGTRVVARGREQARAPLGGEARHPVAVTETSRRLGPFVVGDLIGRTESGEWYAGVDPVLRRSLWLHVLPAGRPPLEPALRDLARPGRLRWLNGLRRTGEAWDAYDAPGGAALVELARRPRPWRDVRFWLRDLAQEIDAGERDGTTPALSLDRVWITRTSRAVLLDAPRPGTAGEDDALAPQPFLAAVATAARPSGPLPLSARRTLDALAEQRIAPGPLEPLLRILTSAPDEVSRWRRGVSIALTSAPLIFVALGMLALLPLVSRVARPEFLLPINCLIEINKAYADDAPASIALRRPLEMYCSAAYGRTYRDAGFWSDFRAKEITTPLHPVAIRTLEHVPTVSPEDAAAAAAETRSTLTEDDSRSGAATALAIMLALPSAILLVCAAVAVVSVLAVRGGLVMRLLGLAVVDSRGQLVSRARGVTRALLAWSPVLLLWVWLGTSLWVRHRPLEATFSSVWIVGFAVLAFTAGGVWSIAHPARGLQDRISGTTLVPR